MKIKVGNKLYLQRYDIAVLLHVGSEFPNGLLGTIFNGEDGAEIFIINGEKDYAEFAYFFDDSDQIEWLENQDWIIDYNEYEEKPFEDLISLRRSLQSIFEYDEEAFEKQCDDYKEAHRRDFYESHAKDSHRIQSIDIMIGEKRGRIKFEFPEGAEIGESKDDQKKQKTLIEKITERLFYA